MTGNNDRIHGFNIQYRSSTGPAHLHSFDWVGNCPTAFIKRKVPITGSQMPALDHQGHIVPQIMLDLILKPLLAEMAQDCYNPDDVNTFINKQVTFPWLKQVFHYGKAIGAPMFDFEEEDPGDRLGNFFSIVTWNPVNICRTPADEPRSGYPHEAIDRQVINYLGHHQAAQGVNPEWLLRLQNLTGNLSLANLNAYIAACCLTLQGQLELGTGYYSFPWQDHNGILVPERMQM
ncbi:hypothetical protein ACR1PO_03330 [Chryseobacterium sp. RRHN12]|uniref:hypothetical protein n=1 Tax=Chryseobacterium sp. RRHN12 TaxID=3437884 RepID=UPI003D9B6E3B